MVSAAAALIMAALWCSIAWREAASRRKSLLLILLKRDKLSLKACFGGPGFLFALEQLGVVRRAEEFLAGLHASLIILRGEEWTPHKTRLYIAGSFVQGYGAVIVGLLLAAAAGESAIAWIGLICGSFIPLARVREIRKAIRKRRESLLLALPDLLGKLMLLIGAGETMSRALARCAIKAGRGKEELLYAELSRIVNAMSNGLSFSAAMEIFSRRCAVQEVSVFTTVLLLNYRRGGEQLALSLREISHPLWEKRKSMARTRGEEASSKLVFPLTGVFFILMVLVGSPAMLLMR